MENFPRRKGRGGDTDREQRTYRTWGGGSWSMSMDSSNSKGEMSKRRRTCSATPRVTSSPARLERKLHILRIRMALPRRILPAR